ncbi:Y-family DNA polymerase [Corticicoccus populi]|uniref:Y-family DNA polymerase n=1 Tax=Corticicoccus populi TaxID=1812821 RepID=A0ABW5WW59_9STAP
MSDIFTIDYVDEKKRQVICVDAKSFFASVEAAERGQNPLEARIAVVSKPENKGGLVLASSPRIKEEYGVQTGTRIYEIPPGADIEIVEPRMALYVERNLDIQRIFKRYVQEEDILVYSIDESFLDITKYHHLFGSPYRMMRKIQRDVWKELGLVLTIGMGDNPLLAKLALDHDAKHDALNHFISVWHYTDVQEKVWPIKPLSKFWGIGHRMERALNRLGIQSIYDLSQYDLKQLKKEFGVIGEQLFFHAHGVDRSEISDKYTPKSTSFSRNQILNTDYVKKTDVEIVIREMTDENAVRMRKHGFVTSRVGLYIGYSKNVPEDGFSKHMTIDPTDSSKKLKEYLLLIFGRHYEGYPVRTVNITFGHFEKKQNLDMQLNLFEPVEENIKGEHLDQTVDKMRRKYGYTSILHASSLMDGAMAKYRATLLGGHRSGKGEKNE